MLLCKSLLGNLKIDGDDHGARGLPGDGAAYHVRSQLVERGYATRLGRSPAGDLVVTVTTEHYLRAEVEGLVWLGGGRIATKIEADAAPRAVG